MKRGAWPWLIAGAAAVAVLVVLLVPRWGQAAPHPDPRPGVTADKVLPLSLVPGSPGALDAYEAARRVPQVLDGVYCHCNCSKSFGHRSLLTCFESDHGAHCDICIGEALLAAQLAAQGTSLDEIRRAIDARFGS